MTDLQIHQFFCRSDNYGVLLHDPQAGVTASIDAPETAPIRNALAERGWRLTHILTTHHHHDHIAGHQELKSETGCKIIGPEKSAGRIPGIDETVKEGDEIRLGEHRIKVLETPGHTLDHLSYWFPEDKIAFVGDTLFSLGCGRLFEGDAEMMWSTLQKLMALPKDTSIYCGHEYTQSNADFALSIEANNKNLLKRAEQVATLRTQGCPTLPVLLSDELSQNPFLRPDSPEIQQKLGMTGHPLATIFAELRRLKDQA